MAVTFEPIQDGRAIGDMSQDAQAFNEYFNGVLLI